MFVLEQLMIKYFFLFSKQASKVLNLGGNRIVCIVRVVTVVTVVQLCAVFQTFLIVS